MGSLFPSHLISGSATQQTELDAAIKANSSIASRVVWIAVSRPEFRQWYEERWPLVQEYLDADFPRLFCLPSHHEKRAWEFHLAVALIEHGISLSTKDWTHGPDFCVLLPDNKKMWIEAISCDRGTEDGVPPPPDLRAGEMYSHTGSIEDDHRPRALRITGAIHEKHKKFQGYVSDDNCQVTADDVMVIAVDGSAIQHFSDPEALFQRAVLGRGLQVIPFRNGNAVSGSFYRPSPITLKKAEGGDKEIPANCMEMDELVDIGAVIYCGHTADAARLNGYEVGDDFLFAYHTKATRPVPPGTFKFGTSFKKNPTSGAIVSEKQNT